MNDRAHLKRMNIGNDFRAFALRGGAMQLLMGALQS